MTISVLHCGHSTLDARVPALLLELGASISAIQSSKHFSCATNEHEHGDRHSDDVSSSSVSSLKHIQHFLISSSSTGGLTALCASASFCASLCASTAGVACSDGGEFSKSVWESTDCAEKLFVLATFSCRDDEDSAGGEALRCEAGRCGGRDAMAALGMDDVTVV